MSNSEKNEIQLIKVNRNYKTIADNDHYHAFLLPDNKLMRFFLDDRYSSYGVIFFSKKEGAILAYNSARNNTIKWEEEEDTDCFNDMTHETVHHFTDETFLDDFVEYLI